MMTVLWVLIGIICGVVGLGILGLVLLFLSSLFVKNIDYTTHSRYYRFLLNLATLFAVVLCRVRIHVTGAKKAKGIGRFLLVSNHRSNLDPILTWWILHEYDLAFLSKQENFKIPILGKIVRKCCFMPIDRKNPKNAIITIKKAANLLKNDTVSVGVYPEGTRNKENTDLLPFHDGVFRIAKLAEVPIIVCSVRGTENFRKFYPRRKTDVYLDFDLITKEEAEPLSSHELSKRAQDIMDKRLFQTVTK